MYETISSIGTTNKNAKAKEVPPGRNKLSYIGLFDDIIILYYYHWYCTE